MSIISVSLNWSTLAALSIVFLVGSAKAQNPAADFPIIGATPDKRGQVHFFSIDKEGQTATSKKLDGALRHKRTNNFPVKPKSTRTQRSKQKIGHLLRQRMTGNSRSKVEVVVTLRDSLKTPRFPALPPSIRKEGGDWRAIRRPLITQQIKQRLRAQGAVQREMKEKGIIFSKPESFWLINSFRVITNAAEVQRMANLESIESIVLDVGRMKPLDNNPKNNIKDGRAAINSDIAVGVVSPKDKYLGIIDTGIASEHILFEDQFSKGFLFSWDCANGDEFCGDNLDPKWDPEDCDGHGTSVAAISWGNGKLGDEFRGVSPFLRNKDGFGLDSYKIQSNECVEGEDTTLSTAAIIRAIQTAISNGNEVINLSFGYFPESGNPDEFDCYEDPISLAVDKAYDAGMVVIAANGNEGPGPFTVNSPACAHKVLGIGAFNVQDPTLGTEDFQSIGPTSDGRIKPEIQAPSGIESAALGGSDALDVSHGTSIAAPFAAGAATLIRAQLDQLGSGDPGQVYAMMILNGRNSSPFPDEEGAGPLFLHPACGSYWFGNTDITQKGDVIEIDLKVVPNTQRLAAAAWWPEDEGVAHNDIDLQLKDPNGKVVVESEEGDSVFERLSTPGFNLKQGTWRMSLIGHEVPNGPQTVYYAAFASGCFGFQGAP